MCEQSAMVAVASRWTKRDVEQHFGLPPEKVVVVPLAPPTGAYDRVGPDEAEAAATRLGLPPMFVLYPAQTWPHKNHLALLEALATLRRGGLVVPFVSTGRLTEHFRVLQQRATRLGIADQVYWLGFVPPRDLSAVYSRATAVIIPTRFEAASAPLWEAFLAGVPAACSTVTSLPEQAGDAALLFDPDRTDQLAEAIRELWEDSSLRSTLVSRGRERVGSFSWDRTARLFRAHYRRLAGRTLDEVDRQLIAESTLI
jgi:glycosyltransferase involved in cell wall biosynthesis